MSVRNLKRSLTFSVTGALLLSASACGNDNVRDDDKPVGQPLAPDQGTNTLPEEQPDGQIRPISNPAPVVPPPAEGDEDKAADPAEEGADLNSTEAPRPKYVNTRPADTSPPPAPLAKP